MRDRAMQALYLLSLDPLRKRSQIQTPTGFGPTAPQQMRSNSASLCWPNVHHPNGSWKAISARVSILHVDASFKNP